MSSWEGKSRGTPLGYRIFVWILRNFGVYPAYFLLRFVTVYFFLFSFKTTKPTYFLYRNKLGYSVARSVLMVYRNFFILGQGIIDKVVVMSGIKNRFTYHFDGEQNIRDMVAGGKGGMLLSAHIGNWDIAGHLLKRIDTVINIVIFDAEHAEIKAYLDGVTGRKSVRLIVIKNDLSHIYAINDAFQNNELVCMHADRFLEGNKTITADFLGETAKFPIGPFVLAAKFKVPVSYVFAVKESMLHYHFFSSKPVDYSVFPKNEMAPAMAKDFVAEMETKLRVYPEQWFNYYNFWAK